MGRPVLARDFLLLFLLLFAIRLTTAAARFAWGSRVARAKEETC